MSCLGHGFSCRRSASWRQGPSRCSLDMGAAPEVLGSTHTWQQAGQQLGMLGKLAWETYTADISCCNMSLVHNPVSYEPPYKAPVMSAIMS